jgi:hypothetical protein
MQKLDRTHAAIEGGGVGADDYTAVTFDGAARLIAAALLKACDDAKRGDDTALAWLTESPQAALWLEGLGINADRVPNLNNPTIKTRNRSRTGQGKSTSAKGAEHGERRETTSNR